ncbi:MAG: flagellar basal body-associated FliL family protein [Candidatus Cloacimonetes bacterium]|nr:flagellar basal body-associated FliL family protein [Candidatus Cloacimonadota bacterium]
MLNNSGKINILIIIIIVLVNMIILGVAYFFLIYQSEPNGDASPELTTLEKTEVAPHRQKVDPTPSSLNTERSSSGFGDHSAYNTGGKDYLKDFALFNIDPLTINLAGEEPKYLVVSIAFEYRLSDKKLPDELRNKIPLLKDKLISYFSKLRIEDVRNHDNREIFKDDIISIINQLLLEGRITNVLFDQFVFQ